MAFHSSIRAAWHVIMAYDQFDEDGDNVHRGEAEQFWPGRRKSAKRGDNLNQAGMRQKWAWIVSGIRVGQIRLGEPAKMETKVILNHQ